MRETIRFAALAFCLSFLFCATASRGQAQVDDVWYVLERTIPAPVSRSNWIAVGRSDAQRDGWRIVPRAPTSFAMALALADAYRLVDRFKTVCDKGFNVYKDPRTRTLSVSRDAVGGQILQRTGLCCEDAFDLAFPTPAGAAPATSDCRTLSLMSVPGATVRPTSAGWRSTSGTPIPIPLVPPMWIPPANPSPAGGGSCQTVQRINQSESRDASGRITVEAATIHVMNCPAGQVYVYQYLNRPGFRAIRPPDWGRAIGNQDFPTFEQAQQAVTGDETPVTTPPVNPKDSIFWGTWNGMGNAEGITVTFNRDYSMTFSDARPWYVRNGGGKWHRDPDRIDCVGSPINYSLWYKNGTLIDPWGNLYTK